jgi:hypothetical protein
LEPYKDPWLSLVRYVKGISATAVAQNLVLAAPAFVNLDAHAQFNTLPESDFLAIAGFSLHISGKLMSIFCQIGVSTYNDVDNLRHIDLMNLVMMSFLPEQVIPIYSAGNVTTPVLKMVVPDGPMVDPTSKDNVRSLQMLTIRLLPIGSVSALPNG